MSSGTPAPDPKREVAAAIARAQADLEHAVHELGRLPALDVHAVALAVHALTSFLTVTGAVVDLLIPVLRDHPDRQVRTWLEGLSHGTALMTHTVSHLMNSSVSVPITLRLEDVDVVRLVERACAYHRREAERYAIVLACRIGADVPDIRTDRLLLASVVDSVLSNAIMQAPPRTTVDIEVRGERDGVVCHVRDAGTGVSADGRARVFVPTAHGQPAIGYGLAVATRFVDELGGELTTRHAPGRGGTTSVWLPRIRSAV